MKDLIAPVTDIYTFIAYNQKKLDFLPKINFFSLPANTKY